MRHFRIFGSPQNANTTFGELMNSSALPEPPIKPQQMSLMERVTMIVAALLGFVSGIWTFRGAMMIEERVGGESFETVASAGLLGLTASAALVTAWYLLSQIIPKLSSQKLRRSGAALTAAVLLFGYCVSSLNNAAALTGPSALLMQMEEDRSSLAIQVAKTARSALAIEPYLGQLQSRAQSFCAGKEIELDSGGFSGAGGPGAVSGALTMMCEDARGNAASIAAIVEATKTGLVTVEEHLSDMEAVIYDHDLTVFEREDKFLLLAREVEAWMRSAGTSDMAEALVTSQRAMAAGVATLSTQGGSFGQTQASVIQGLKESIAAIGDVYQTVADQVATLPEPDTTPIRRASLVRVTIKYGFDALPQLAAAFGIDTFMLLALTALGLARRENAEAQEAAKAEFKDQEKEIGPC